ncbi:MAG: WD40/YVTN/BNR-like repeat-containing protein [Anaerolineales bacterium]
MVTPMQTTSTEPSIIPEATRPSTSRSIEPFEPGQMPVVRSIHMQSSLEGWAIGASEDDPLSHDHVLWTEDGGQTWIDMSPSEDWVSVEPMARDLGAVHFGADRAWILYRGSDLMWHVRPHLSGWARIGVGDAWAPLSTLTFTDGDHGWLMQSVEAGMGTELVALYRTLDGGLSWDPIVDPYEDEDLQICFKTGIQFHGAETGWVTVDCQGNYADAFLLISEDGGGTWNQLTLPRTPQAPSAPEVGYCYSSSPTLVSEQTGVLKVDCLMLADDDLVESSYLYSTEDTGISWEIHEFPGGQLRFFDDGTMLALARDQYRSTDGGATWTKIKSVEWDGQYSFVDLNTGWAVATNEGEIALVRTTDGGATWEIVEPVIASD